LLLTAPAFTLTEGNSNYHGGIYAETRPANAKGDWIPIQRQHDVVEGRQH